MDAKHFHYKNPTASGVIIQGQGSGADCSLLHVLQIWLIDLRRSNQLYCTLSCMDRTMRACDQPRMLPFEPGSYKLPSVDAPNEMRYSRPCEDSWFCRKHMETLISVLSVQMTSHFHFSWIWYQQTPNLHMRLAHLLVCEWSLWCLCPNHSLNEWSWLPFCDTLPLMTVNWIIL